MTFLPMYLLPYMLSFYFHCNKEIIANVVTSITFEIQLSRYKYVGCVENCGFVNIELPWSNLAWVKYACICGDLLRIRKL